MSKLQQVLEEVRANTTVNQEALEKLEAKEEVVERLDAVVNGINFLLAKHQVELDVYQDIVYLSTKIRLSNGGWVKDESIFETDEG